MDNSQSYLVHHAILTAIIYAVGRRMQRGIGAATEARRVHGRYVFWWSFGAFTVGGLLGLWFVAADHPNGANGLAMFCLLGGWLVGTLHGAVVLAARRRKRGQESITRNRVT